MFDWKKIFEEVKRAAEDKVPFEACGVITNDGIVIVTENVFEPQSHRFTRYQVDPIVVHEQNRHDNIFGFFHSHPNGSAYPSTMDNLDASSFPGKFHLIVGMHDGKAVDVRGYIAMWTAQRGVTLVPRQPLVEDAVATA